jgi:hypothetical protein
VPTPPVPPTIDETLSPTAVYTARERSLQTQYDAAANLASKFKLALLVVFAAVLAVIFFNFRSHFPAWPILPAGLIAAVLTNRLLSTRRVLDRLIRLLRHYELALGRVNGTRIQSDHNGEEFRTPTHLYDRDLSILGPESIFGLLSTVRTGVGRQGLANYLLHLPSGDVAHDEIATRRKAIQELTPRNDLRQDIALLGSSRFQEVAAKFFDKWLESGVEKENFHAAIRPALYVTSSLLVLMLFLGLTGLVAWAPLRPNLLAVFAIQGAIAISIRKPVVAILESASRLANQVEMFRDGLALLQTETYTSPRLQSLQEASRTPHNAIPVIAALQRQLVVVEQRTKEWFLMASLLLCAGTHAAISISNWKRNHAHEMKQWLAAWAEFETLNALATYAYEHPENIYPEILTNKSSIFQASDLRHPLLPVSAVGNTVSLNEQASLYLISGSNMAGKSTLLRTIGLNAVLASLGLPICASSAKLSPFTIGASIALSDSLAEGKSKFLAEVERLHAILQAAQTPASQPVLFLIDEIFSGTNSLDRRVAANSVARWLVANGAIGALSTHDLTLTEMADDDALRATNVHMASPNPADPLAFDYILKPGINQTSNALAILHMMGLET